MNKWHRPETYLAALSMSLAAFIGTPYAREVPSWALAIVLALLPALQLLSGQSTATKALETPPPASKGNSVPKTGTGGPIVGILLASLLASGCAGWQSTARKSLSIAQDVGVSAHIEAVQVGKATVEQCAREKLNPCPALLSMQKARKPLLLALVNWQQSVIVAAQAVDLGNEPAAMKAVTFALEAAQQVCRAVRDWGHPVAACAYVGVEVSK